MKPIKLPSFEDHLKESLKDPISKAIYDTWGDALMDEIRPRDKIIRRLRLQIKKLREKK